MEDIADRRRQIDGELSELETVIQAFGSEASPAQQRYLDSRIAALGQEAAQLARDAARVAKDPPVRSGMSAPGHCGNCGGYRVTKHRSQQGDVMTASVLTTLGIAITAGGLSLLYHCVVPVFPPGIVIGIVVGLLGLICTRSGYRARPMGPVRTIYTCDLCGYAWEAGQAPPLARPNPKLLRLAEEEQRRRANSDAVAITDYERHRNR
jgi:hypothetical protein